ncbi:macrophage mannose receptor 1-like [Thunnus thynnus]|uniref:macrophage mannose receptor 1-like n=1 Tax=Thunnus thynnus TaxID=8237 RepID=UPI0035270506
MMMMMKSCLSGPFLLLLLLLLSSTVSGLGSVVWKKYTVFRNHLTWKEAQSFCRRNNYIDLAIFYTESDADSTNMGRYRAWIGLHKDTDTSSSTHNKWIWSDGQNYSIKWAYGEPDSTDVCAYAFHKGRRIYGANCKGNFFFFCQKLQNTYSKYTFIPQSKTWSEAQDYCRKDYDGLAAFSDYDKLMSALKSMDFPVWTGLYKDGKAWKWSSGLSEYRNWAVNEPGNKGDCVSISSVSKKMAAQNCAAQFPSICFTDNLVLVKENKTWEEALEHCRSLKLYYQRYDLVSVQPGVDNNYVMNKVKEAVTERVWAGLRFLAGHWLWVNGADMLYSDLPLCPLKMQQCGAFSRNEMGGLEIRDCTEKMNFLCYGWT